MKKYSAISSFLILIAIACGGYFVNAVLVPQSASAAYGGLVTCDGVVEKDAQGRQIDPSQKTCNFNELIKQINHIISWLFGISLSIAIVFLAYGGILYMTGTEGNITQAKGIFSSVGWGFIIMLSAWLVIYTLLNWLTKPGQGFTSLLDK